MQRNTIVNRTINYFPQSLSYDECKIDAEIQFESCFKRFKWSFEQVEGFMLEEDAKLVAIMFNNEIDRMIYALAMARVEIEYGKMTKKLFECMKLDIQDWFEMDLFKYISEEERNLVREDARTVSHYIGKHWDEY